METVATFCRSKSTGTSLTRADTLTVYTHNAAGVRGGSVGFAVPAPVQSQFPPQCVPAGQGKIFLFKSQTSANT